MSSHLLFREAYHQEINDEREHLRTQRAKGVTARVELPGLYRSRRVCDLSDSQIEDIALRQAERTICEVIHKHNDERLAD